MTSRRRPLREKQMLDKRERIRAAAWHLFSTEGFESTTTKAIAERAGVATGTLFLYASDKDDLLFLVMNRRISDAVEAGFATLPRGPLLEQLMHLFGELFAMYRDHPEVAKHFVRAFPGASGPNAQEMNAITFAFLHRVAELVRAAQTQGEAARDVAPEQLAQNVFAMYYFALLSWVGGYATIETALDPGLKGALALQLRALKK